MEPPSLYIRERRFRSGVLFVASSSGFDSPDPFQYSEYSMTPQAEMSLFNKKKILHARTPITGKSAKFATLRIIFFLISLFYFYGAWSIGRLRAEESSQKNFTMIRSEEISRLENLHQRADSLMGQKNFRGAIDVYSEILLIEPDDDAAYINMAQAYMVLGDFRQAGNAFENALHINPDNEIARSGLRKIANPDFSSMATPSPAPSPLKLEPKIPKALSSTPSGDGLLINSNLSFNQWSQIALKNARFYNGPIDGKISDSMKKAIEIFQEQNHLEVDGMVGPTTWAKLKQYLNKDQ